jgi:DNA mismatch repair protein MutH
LNAEKYDKSSVDSIYQYSLLLTGKSLAEVLPSTYLTDDSVNKGSLGTLVEKYYFETSPPNTHEPDFPEAGLELKTTGLKINSQGEFRAKERLVLSMINYNKIVQEEWHSSYLLNKCKAILILFYLYEKEIPAINRKFIVAPLLYLPSESEMRIFQKDWEFIKDKVLAGKAHELSEGDTFFLGACRKGSGGPDEYLKSAPGNDIKAKARAFSLKPSFVNQILESHLADLLKKRNPVMSENELVDDGLIEASTQKRLKEFEGKSIEEIAIHFNIPEADRTSKGINYTLALLMLGGGGRKKIPAIEKAGIEIKTIGRESNGKVRESMSFPGFKFMEIVNQEWIDSSFCERIERKFLFFVFQKDKHGKKVFKYALFWNMPYQDRLEAERVFEETKRRVRIDATDLPTARESSVAHVRPKATNAKDTLPTPQGGAHTKQCFWLNNTYIEKVLDELQP